MHDDEPAKRDVEIATAAGQLVVQKTSAACLLLAKHSGACGAVSDPTATQTIRSTVDHERWSPPFATMWTGGPSEVMLSLLSFLRPRKLARLARVGHARVADVMWARHCRTRWWDEYAPFRARPQRAAPGAVSRTTARATGRSGCWGGSSSGRDGRPHTQAAGDAATDRGRRFARRRWPRNCGALSARLRYGAHRGLANATCWNDK